MHFNGIKTRSRFSSTTSLLIIVGLKLEQNIMDENIYYERT